jgi:hypothetical protein
MILLSIAVVAAGYMIADSIILLAITSKKRKKGVRH